MVIASQQRAETGSATGTTWTIDPLHSTVGFSIKHLKFATAHGRFTGVQGTVHIDDNRPGASFVTVEIDASTVDTREKKRDEHLRSADFFDVARYPTITFRSTRVEPIDLYRRDRWLLVGDLTIHGVTRSVKLAVEQSGDGPKAWPAEVIAYTATTMFRRKDFGIGLSPLFEAGELLIADDVTIAIEIQAQKTTVTGR